MENNIFDQVGKRTPYNGPEGYFEASEHALRAKVNHKSAIIHHKLPTVSKRWYYAAAASVILVIGIFSIVRFALPSVTPANEPVYVQAYEASEDWSDFADADIFLDNMEW